MNLLGHMCCNRGHIDEIFQLRLDRIFEFLEGLKGSRITGINTQLFPAYGLYTIGQCELNSRGEVGVTDFGPAVENTTDGGFHTPGNTIVPGIFKTDTQREEHLDGHIIKMDSREADSDFDHFSNLYQKIRGGFGMESDGQRRLIELQILGTVQDHVAEFVGGVRTIPGLTAHNDILESHVTRIIHGSKFIQKPGDFIEFQ